MIDYVTALPFVISLLVGVVTSVYSNNPKIKAAALVISIVCLVVGPVGQMCYTRYVRDPTQEELNGLEDGNSAIEALGTEVEIRVTTPLQASCKLGERLKYMRRGPEDNNEDPSLVPLVPVAVGMEQSRLEQAKELVDTCSRGIPAQSVC